MTTLSALRAALDELPDDPDGIATVLALEEITGRPRTGFACPIAKWLERRFTDWDGVVCETYVKDVRTGATLDFGELRSGAALTLFIDRFDNGRYRHLRSSRIARQPITKGA